MSSLGPTLWGDGDDVGLPQLGDRLHQGGRGEGREVRSGERHWTAEESPRGEVKHLMIIIIIIIIDKDNKKEGDWLKHKNEDLVLHWS